MVTPDLTVGRHLNGRPGVGLDVFKSTGANIVDVADRVMAVVEEQRKLPQLQGIDDHRPAEPVREHPELAERPARMPASSAPASRSSCCSCSCATGRRR